MMSWCSSSRPGLLLNSTPDDVEDDTMFPVALCGRVPCKAVDENGPIKRGDLLTTSSTRPCHESRLRKGGRAGDLPPGDDRRKGPRLAGVGHGSYRDFRDFEVRQEQRSTMRGGDRP
jgi:hypothetical protein